MSPVLDPQLAYAALRGNRPTEITRDIGPELVNRAARMALLSDINAQLLVEADMWKQSDIAVQELGMDIGVGVTELEPFIPSNIHEGPHKSLIEAPPEAFPYIALGAHIAVPADGLDQVNLYDITLMIEAWVKSGPVLDATQLFHETTVHRRILRTIEAVKTVINDTKNLYGTILPIENGPRMVIHDMTFISGGEAGPGARYLQQGARLQYTLQRTSAL